MTRVKIYGNRNFKRFFWKYLTFYDKLARLKLLRFSRKLDKKWLFCFVNSKFLTLKSWFTIYAWLSWYVILGAKNTISIIRGVSAVPSRLSVSFFKKRYSSILLLLPCLIGVTSNAMFLYLLLCYLIFYRKIEILIEILWNKEKI